MATPSDQVAVGQPAVSTVGPGSVGQAFQPAVSTVGPGSVGQESVGQAFQPAVSTVGQESVGQAFQPAVSTVGQAFQAFQPAIAFADLSIRKRHLPHWELSGSTYFITFRVIHPLGRPLWNASRPDTSLAKVVEDAIHFHHDQRYILDAYVVMPDHVHLLIRPIEGWSVPKIMQGLKGFTARRLNAALCRQGSFWQAESFDHLVRHEADWLDKFAYIHANPVTAGLVSRAEEYPYSSVNKSPHTKPATKPAG